MNLRFQLTTVTSKNARFLVALAAAAFLSLGGVGMTAESNTTKPKANKNRKTAIQEAKEKGNPFYSIEDIATPPGLVAECGGLAVMPDGRVVATFHRGEVYTYEPGTKEWRLFADGLHDPLGVIAISNSEIVVMQRPELTRIKDTDGDGAADTFETINDEFGMSGNYHEFAFGPVLDKEGNFVIALNCASSGAGIRNELRGAFNSRSYMTRMYSAVPWRGWIVKISPQGRLTPWALGFRSPNGLGYDAEGNLFVGDNQGDWIGACPLYHVEQGKFYGHPASLAWKEGETRVISEIPIQELDAMRTRPAVVFPYGTISNSPTQPLLDSTGGKFGPFAGQMLIGEMNRAMIIRMVLEKVDGQLQGACIPLVAAGLLRKGINRLAFGPDGSLWIGQTDHGWAGDRGLQRITWNGKTPVDVLSMKLTKSGFDLTFTRPMDAAIASQAKSYRIRRYNHDYHPAYGSKEFDVEEVPVRSAMVSSDGRRVSIDLGDLVAWRLYECHLDALKSADGTPMTNPMVTYTLNHLLENTPPPPPPARDFTKADKSTKAEKAD